MQTATCGLRLADLIEKRRYSGRGDLSPAEGSHYVRKLATLHEKEKQIIQESYRDESKIL